MLRESEREAEKKKTHEKARKAERSQELQPLVARWHPLEQSQPTHPKRILRDCTNALEAKRPREDTQDSGFT